MADDRTILIVTILVGIAAALLVVGVWVGFRSGETNSSTSQDPPHNDPLGPGSQL